MKVATTFTNNNPKVDDVGRALYFSRACIPTGSENIWHHIGIYAWKRKSLKKFISFPVSNLEKTEKLEQLNPSLIKSKSNKNKEIILEKSGFDNEQAKYLINVYFENNPMILRKIEVYINNEFLQISILNHSYNEDFNKDLFKLIIISSTWHKIIK